MTSDLQQQIHQKPDASASRGVKSTAGQHSVLVSDGVSQTVMPDYLNFQDKAPNLRLMITNKI